MNQFWNFVEKTTGTFTKSFMNMRLIVEKVKEIVYFGKIQFFFPNLLDKAWKKLWNHGTLVNRAGSPKTTWRQFQTRLKDYSRTIQEPFKTTKGRPCSQLELLLNPTSYDPSYDPSYDQPVTSLGPHYFLSRTTLKTLVRTPLKIVWDHIVTILELLWKHSRTTLRYLQNNFGFISRSLKDHPAEPLQA